MMIRSGKGSRGRAARFFALMLAVMLGVCGVSGAAAQKKHRISDRSAEVFGNLLVSMLNSARFPGRGYEKQMDKALEELRGIDSADYSLGLSLAEHWKMVYLGQDPSYTRHIMKWKEGDEPRTAEELLNEPIPDSPKHAFVVLGFELDKGEMRPELMGRCEAAAAAARAFPHTLLVCSGGATGAQNPEKHTEAGMMKKYLSEHCGIDPERIEIDEKALSTVENVLNTFAILRRRGVESITVISSSYHQRWGEVLYHAQAELEAMAGGERIRILGNYAFDVTPEAVFEDEPKWAIRQLQSILDVPGTVREIVSGAIQ